MEKSERVLHTYSRRQLKIMNRAISFMTSLRSNKIRNKLISLEEDKQKLEVYNSISRLAFEYEDCKRITIKYVEHHGLETIPGFLSLE